MKENFIITENEDGTYQVADKKGHVFEWGKSVKDVYVYRFSPNYIRVYETTELSTIYDKKGRMLEGTKCSKDVYINDDGSYEVWKNGQKEYFDNGAKKRKYLKRTAGVIAGLCALSLAAGGITKCTSNAMQKIEVENKIPATYLGTWQMKGYQYMMFDTDGDDKTVEYYGYPKYMHEVGKVLQIPQGEKRSIGAWRKMGLKIESAKNVMVKD